MVKVFLSGVIIVAGIAGYMMWPHEEVTVKPAAQPVLPTPLFTPTPSATPTSTPKPTALPIPQPYDVPFTAQAPTANWGDKLYQNACEESSILMAARWLAGDTITPQYALVEIRVLADRAKALFGNHLDESARDTATLAQDYLPDASVELIEQAASKDIINSISSGKVVLVPLNGKMLKNPYYKPPGPLRHMLVVKGYDSNTKEFITNDPGTRVGKGYRYNEDVLFAAMHDWDTGDNAQVYPDRKVVIAIGQ
ncbi:MAG: hypothetical protein A3C02_04310 [Candidatus Andersenbacteria bacterium RIFCSPHIGHO2_02_FULL_45_11]|uniref:Peptidase C39-like domain-containing protein n=1 Tax=Candidatus Andersenbacteria bacterium RIFCSPHIGHO2_12_FULL_45_11 TaxID=1797281 RepID=A0A1G1X1K9_9BACT|nr:MAG: hypothetical protein A3C02_04310 [Candidatus Andersenbacteria bacterium RIFCSPHIGHO2_02_FULL_45_11]OGY33440.1 MAG: hypothetical protein A3D99_04840 [Candidatus Andersenbacteria bacterium RIFCSPHIGHO2_12_FULL_45_11]